MMTRDCISLLERRGSPPRSIEATPNPSTVKVPSIASTSKIVTNTVIAKIWTPCRLPARALARAAGGTLGSAIHARNDAFVIPGAADNDTEGPFVTSDRRRASHRIWSSSASRCRPRSRSGSGYRRLARVCRSCNRQRRQALGRGRGRDRQSSSIDPIGRRLFRLLGRYAVFRSDIPDPNQPVFFFGKLGGQRSDPTRPGIAKCVDRALGSAYMSWRGTDKETWPAGSANYDPGPSEGPGSAHSLSSRRGPSPCRSLPRPTLTTIFPPLLVFQFMPVPNLG